jgi:hypothetical protein
METPRPGRTRTTSISLAAETLEAIRERAGKGGVSAFIEEAVRHELAMLALGEIVADHEARHGAFTPAEVAAAEAELFGAAQDGSAAA